MQTEKNMMTTAPHSGIPLPGSDLQSQEALIVAENNRMSQTVIDLCPRFLTPELGIYNYDKDWNLLEFPVLKTPARKIKEGVNQEAELDMVRASIVRIEATLKPAEPNQMKEVLGRLVLHKGVGNYSEGQSIALINDYMRLLSDCPYDLLFKACDECILDPNMQYFPQVGRLRDKMAKEMRLRQLYLGRLRKILELSQFKEQRPMEPRPIELGASLAAKFRG